ATTGPYGLPETRPMASNGETSFPPSATPAYRETSTEVTTPERTGLPQGNRSWRTTARSRWRARPPQPRLRPPRRAPARAQVPAPAPARAPAPALARARARARARAHRRALRHHRLPSAEVQPAR